MIKNYKHGDTVWFEHPFCDGVIVSGNIKNVEQQTLAVQPLRVHTDVIIEYYSDIGPRAGLITSTVKSPAFLFESESACLQQMKIDSGEIDIRDVYRAEIQSVKDLMIFIFTHDITARHENPAYEVALEQTARLLGFEHFDMMLGAIEV